MVGQPLVHHKLGRGTCTGKLGQVWDEDAAQEGDGQ